jgi:hypothetical protein
MTTDREPIPEIAEVLYGVEEAEGSVCPTQLETGITDPPTYMVQLALVVGGHRIGGPSSLAAWAPALLLTKG